MEAADFARLPEVASAGEQLGVGFLLRDQQVVGQRRGRLEVAELVAPVVWLGGVGQHFDNQERVEQGVGAALIKQQWPADDRDVRERVDAVAGVDFYVLAKDPAAPRGKGVAEGASNVHSDDTMIRRAAAHGADFAIDVFPAS